jgi:poly(hydroxyalkanoate) granule-associated protein
MKTQQVKERVEHEIRNFGENARQTSRRLFLAGLGAASSVETRSREVFDQLVEKGKERSERDLFTVPAPLREAGERVKTFGRELESRIERGTTSTLERFGVPDREEVQNLIERIEQLTTKVEELAASRA